MSEFSELRFTKTMRNVICCLKVNVLTDISTKFFWLKNVLATVNGSPEIYFSSHQRADNIDQVNKFA